MKQIQFILFAATIFLLACRPDKKKASAQIEHLQPMPVVLDTNHIEPFINLYNGENYFSGPLNFHLFYIGKAEDTIYIKKMLTGIPSVPLPPSREDLKTRKRAEIRQIENPLEKYFIDREDGSKYKQWDSAKIEIQLDTMQKLYNTYPVMLSNLDSESVIIGNTFYIPLIMQAQDSFGHWHPIQDKPIIFCGFGIRSIILPPKECTITLVPICKGDYRTQLRLTLGSNHSKPFNGFITYRSLERKFD